MRLLSQTACALFAGAMTMTPGLATDAPYPRWMQGDAVDSYFGEKISDPFRWLETAHSKETTAFIERQNALTADWLPATPRASYRQRLQSLINYPRQSVPAHEGKVWITSRNSGLQQHAVIFKQADINGQATVLIDPNTFSKDGTISLSLTEFSRDGTLVAYGKSIGGSDDQTIHVRQVADGKDRPDILKDMRFSSVAWAPDAAGFWYNRFPDPAVRANSTLYWHKLGGKQAQDAAVLSLPHEPDVDIFPSVTEAGDYLFIYKSTGTSEKNGLLVRRTSGQPEAAGGFREVFPMDAAMFGVVANEGPALYVYTDKDAPRRRLIAMDINKPGEKNWREILPQSDDLLTDIRFIAGRFIAVYTRDVHSIVKIFEKDGTFVREIPLPTKGTVSGLSGKSTDEAAFFLFNSYTYPGTIYRYEIADGTLSEYYRSQIAFDPSAYETEQIFCTSKDGTRVPMFVTHGKGLTRDGTHPAILYGYGGFSISLDPAFNPMIIPWLENGGIYAVANLRGGGEYGSDWHDSGSLARKQNVFDDFIAAAGTLISEKFTNSQKLAIEGGSNGGLLVAAVMLQRPDLFGAVVSQVPVTDMLRYQKFGTGRYWITEYGDATASKEAFQWLRAYSPLHNVIKGKSYPPLLVTTADGDDRVAPLHAFKFIATMQTQAGPGSYLLRHEIGAGHGAGKPLEKVIAEQADIYAFLTRALGLEK